MPGLEGLQTRFAKGLLTAGDDPAHLFRGDPALTARRFALYRGNLTANWDRSLGIAYPVLRKLVGAELFRGLAREYGRAVPFVEGDLNRFGESLADFLQDFLPVADYPFLPDMVRLEWALHRAHYAADTPALSLTALAEVGADTLGEMHLCLREACTLLRSSWAIAQVWKAHQPEGPPWPEDIAKSSLCLVCRPRWRPEVIALSPGDYEALRALEDGESLGVALETATVVDPDFSPAHALPAWLQAGIFTNNRSAEANIENRA